MKRLIFRNTKNKSMVKEEMMTKRLFIGTIGLGLMALLLAAAACGGSSDADASTVPSGGSDVTSNINSQPGDVQRNEALGASTIQFSPNQQVGISVSAQGEVTAAPDLATLNLGVESRATTVAEARSAAAEAMDAVVNVLRARGIEEKDIQTRFFNMSPDFRWNDVKREQELVGFIVTNQVVAKIRNLESAGIVIDEVANAAGDLIRISGLSFGIEDTTALEAQAREQAMNSLLAKAQQYADLADVTVGRPVSLSESSGFAPTVRAFADQAFAEAATAAPTSISPGELTVTISVQGVFAIE